MLGCARLFEPWVPPDFDDDGFPDDEDCAPFDPTSHAGAVDVCDGVDNDCDGLTDEDGAISIWYVDTDGDGFGTEPMPRPSCHAPAGSATRTGDCAPRDPWAFPGAEERCNQRDDDCDGAVDEDPTDEPTWFPDRDGDGYGDDAGARAACEAPAGAWVDVPGDCDDGNPEINPGAREQCTPAGIDDDCDGEVDEEGGDGPVLWYTDADGDGYGAGHPREACAGADDESALGTDCDDTDPFVYPTTFERCDGVDEDCDGAVDEDPVDGGVWYLDGDGDGWGDPGSPVYTCEAPSDAVVRGDDCDDADPTVHPTATEDCTIAVDMNCDGLAGSADADGDGFAACTECDDGDAGAYPGAPERCDGVDQDCDGEADVGAPGYQEWHPDMDRDGWGDPTTTRGACDPVRGWTASGGDCDDTQSDVHPTATERCSTAADDDCDGSTNDPGAAGCSSYAVDVDGDGDGRPEGIECLCEPEGVRTATSSRDCDDQDPETYRGAEELGCDHVDNDCGPSDCTVSPWTTLSGFRSVDQMVPGAGTTFWVGSQQDGLIAAATAGTDATLADLTTIVNGPGRNVGFGRSLAVRDVDGDGEDDLLIGARNVDDPYTEAGAAWFLPGPVTGTNAVEDIATARWDGWESGAFVGAAVLLSDDLTGDGAADGWVSAPDADSSSRDSGVVFHADLATAGSVDASTSDLFLSGDVRGGHFGKSMLGNADLSGDGVADMVVTAPFRTGAALEGGTVFIFTGPVLTEGSAADAAASWDGDAARRSFGYRIAPAGDVDADGIDDLWVANSGGVVFLFGRPGSRSGTSGDATAVAWETEYGTGAAALTGGVDVDGSGRPDLIVGDHQVLGGEGALSVYLDPGTGYLTDTRYTLSVGYGSRGAGKAVAGLPGINPNGTDSIGVSDRQGGIMRLVDLTEVFP